MRDPPEPRGAIPPGSAVRSSIGLARDDIAAPACLFEASHELGAADLDGCDLGGHLAEHPVEEASGEIGGCAAGDAGDGPFGDRVAGGEVLDGVAGGEVDEDGVDLDDLSRPFRLEALGQAFGIALGPTPWPCLTALWTRRRISVANALSI